MADLTAETQQTKDDQRPSDNRRLLLGLMLLLLQNTQKSLHEFSAGYLAGHLTLLELHDALVQTLTDSHAHAAYLGRQLAGQTEAFGPQDTEFAAHVLDGQAQYLEGLFADYESGRYVGEDGEVSGALNNRLDLYARGLRHTANSAWLFNLDPETLLHWKVNPGESCDCCLEMEAGNPYTAGEIDRLPGDCTCGPNCNCEILEIDGEASFPHMEL